MTNDTHDRDAPDDLEALLPWHAVRRLSDDDARRVEEALARDPELARRFALVEEERGQTVALNEALGAPSSRAREQLFARIDATPRARAARGRATLGGWLEALASAFTPRTLAAATAALALLALVQAGFLTGLLVSGDGGQRYETASGPDAGARGEGAFALVAFAPDATAAQIEAFLERRRAVIVDGPRPGGLFRLRIGERRLAPDELARTVAALRAEPVVRLAVPAP
jgi:anti-sigma factor RsiW